MQDPTSLNVLKVSDDNEAGYILEVHLTYPQHLHDEHNDYPLAPEHLKIKSIFNSTRSRITTEAFDHSTKSPLPQLEVAPRVGDGVDQNSQSTSVPASALAQTTHQSKYNKAGSSTMCLRERFLKLINNAVFGKTMENIRKHFLILVRPLIQ